MENLIRGSITTDAGLFLDSFLARAGLCATSVN